MPAIALPFSAATAATTTTYDLLNRPTGVTFGDVPAATAPTTGANVAFTHAYNAVNQRTGQTVSDSAWIDYPPATASSTAYTANALNQYTAVGTVTPAYDTNGNTTSDGTSTLGYDAENRLVSASKTGMTATYTFDGRGRRKTKTVNGTTTVFVTDADNREVLEYDGSTGAILRWYAYGLGSNDVLAQVDVSGGTRLTPVPDLQGSVIATMSNAGTLASFAYRAYGTSTSAPGQFGYTGQRVDAETGYYYYRARQYFPGWGRFPQADPIGHGGGLHLYAYVTNDPLNLIDPLGLEPSNSDTYGIQAAFGSPKNMGFLCSPSSCVHIEIQVYKNGQLIAAYDGAPSGAYGNLIMHSDTSNIVTPVIPNLNLSAPQGQDMATFAQNIQSTAGRYDGSLPYTTPPVAYNSFTMRIPTTGNDVQVPYLSGIANTMAPGTYNSNSLAGGVLVGAGCSSCVGAVTSYLQLNSRAAPGIEQPVPSRYFH